MHKKKVLVNFLLAAMIVAGLFVTPIPVQATMFRMMAYVELRPIDVPPSNMCVGDKAPISFSYNISLMKPGGTPVPAKGGVDATLTGKATGGTLSKTSWDLSGGLGSGTITATYSATKVGNGQIDISTNDLWATITGVTNIGSFKVQECNRTLAISASDFKTTSDWNMDTEFNAKGGLMIGKDGTVTGGGTFTYSLTVTYNNKDPELTCDQPGKMIGNEHFNVVNGSATSGASGGTIAFGLTFDPFTYKDVYVTCHDIKGVTVDKKVMSGGEIDPESDLPFFSNMVFQSDETQKTFPWGDGSGSIWLIKRKGRGK
jgi:hypothetical protein